LKDDGLLVFSYHHSRPDGWASLAAAIFGAGFSVVEAHPVRAEMSVATPKAQASEPIQLDVLLVCRKRSDDLRPTLTTQMAWKRAEHIAGERCARLCAAGFNLSRHDRRVVRGAHFLASLGPIGQMDATEWKRALSALATDATMTSEHVIAPAFPRRPTDTPENLELFA
jgi:putative DNA methylase